MKDYIAIVFSIISIVVCITLFICMAKCSRKMLITDFNFSDASIAVLTILFTAILGWNILDSVSFRKDWDKFNKDWNEKVSQMDQAIHKLELGTYNQIALNMSVCAQLYISKENYSAALNCCVQCLNNMLYDLKTNSDLGNLDNLVEWFDIVLYDKNGNFRGEVNPEDVEYVKMLILNIKNHPNYSIVHNRFDKIIGDIERICHENN